MAWPGLDWLFVSITAVGAECRPENCERGVSSVEGSSRCGAQSRGGAECNIAVVY